MVSGKAVRICSGRWMRSQYRDTGLKQSFTEMSCDAEDSSCCNTGETFLLAKISPGNNSTGRWLMLASAAPVTMFVAPGPIEVVQAKERSRKLVLLKAAAERTIALAFTPKQQT